MKKTKNENELDLPELEIPELDLPELDLEMPDLGIDFNTPEVEAIEKSILKYQ